MLSRRNVRVKLMQALYAQSRDEYLKPEDVLKVYRMGLRHSFELYLYNFLFIIRLAQYSQTDYDRRKAKLRPTEEDRKFTPRLAENELVQSVLQHTELQKTWRAYKTDQLIDPDNVRLMYQELTKTSEYTDYLALPAPTHSDHAEMLVYAYKVCLANDHFNEIVEDAFVQWTDDESLITGALKRTLRALPAKTNFLDDYKPSAEATVEFGETMLKLMAQNESTYLELIKPLLYNWDAERVAVIDMILLKMAVCEMLNFPSIPTKVTLNEYVEISKQYSTDKSKEFINGVLDHLMKMLLKEGKIVKQGRGLLE